MTYAVLVDTSAFYALQCTGDPREHALAAAAAERFESDRALLVTTARMASSGMAAPGKLS